MLNFCWLEGVSGIFWITNSWFVYLGGNFRWMYWSVMMNGVLRSRFQSCFKSIAQKLERRCGFTCLMLPVQSKTLRSTILRFWILIWETSAALIWRGDFGKKNRGSLSFFWRTSSSMRRKGLRYRRFGIFWKVICRKDWYPILRTQSGKWFGKNKSLRYLSIQNWSISR